MKSKSILHHSLIATVLAILLNLLALQPFQPAADTRPDLQIKTSTRTPTRMRTPTPTPTRTRTPTRTPTRWVPHSFDPRIISFVSGMGAGHELCWSEYDKEILKKVNTGRTGVEFLNDSRLMPSGGAICVYGFPVGEQVLVTLFTPDNRKAAEYTLQVELDTKTGPSFPTAGVWIYRSLSLPNGKWRMEAQSNTRKATGSFWIGNNEDMRLTVSHEVDPSVINPGDPRFMTAFSIGDVLVLKGASFPKNSDIPLGFYVLDYGTSEHGLLEDVMKPIMGEIVHTDGYGAFTLAFPLDKRFQPDNYTIVPLLEPERTIYVPWDNHSGFTVIAPQFPCGRNFASRLNTARWARVTAGQPNNVRKNPGRTEQYLGKIFAFQDVWVLDGPACKDGLTWWKVRTVDKQLTGWTAEGDENSYWLLPLSYSY